MPRGAGVNSAPRRVSDDAETEEFPRAVPCCDHAFDDALVCRCGVTWWNHQQLPETCLLNARGRNRGEEANRERTPPTPA